MHDSDESADYESMPEDDLRSVSGFEGVDSDDTQGNDVSHFDHTFPDHNASAERLSLLEHLDHICEEVSPLHSKLGNMESSIIHQVSDAIQSTLPALSDRFVRLETELSKTLKIDMGKSVTTLVKSIMKEVRGDLKSQAKSLGKFSLDVQNMQTQLPDIQSLLESTVIVDDTAGEEKNNRGEQPADLNVVNKESAPPASDAKLNERKELVVHNSEEKKHLLQSKEQQKSRQEFTDQLFKTTSSRFSPTPPKELAPLKDSSKGKNSFSEWLEVHALASKKSGTSNNLLLQSLRAKFQWVINQAKRLGLLLPPELATFVLTAKKKEMKRTELIKEVFVTENIWVDGMDMNLIPSLGIMPIQGLVINEHESGIFFMNRNTDIGIQREKARSDCIKTREIVEKNLDNKEYAEVLSRVRGGNTLTIQSPFEEEQAELKDCSLKHGTDTAYLLLYVDDIVLTASSESLLQQIIGSLHKDFAMTDLGSLNYFLGISVTRDSSGLFLSQKKYASEILERAHMVNCNPSRTPIDTESKLGVDGDLVCLYMHDHREPHFSALKRILRSTSGYCVFLGNNPLSWSSKRQPTLSRYSADVEYRGVDNAVAETFQDQRTKHIEIDIHFVRDLVATGLVRVSHVPSRRQFADIFTKELSSALFEEFRSSLSVRCPPVQTAREC
nr:hypothetical protein [Tanacetum cinerariifolium]